MIGPGRIGHVDGHLKELYAQGFEPVDGVGRSVDERPDQTRLYPPVIVFHEVLEGLVRGVGNVLLLLHCASDGEHAFEEVRGPADGRLLFENGYPRAPLRCLKRCGET